MLVCNYPTEDCTCNGTFWSCNTCPAAQPAEGSSCGIVTYLGLCTYGDVACSCNNGDWACGGCPSTAPAPASSCDVSGLACDYTDQACQCNSPILHGLEWSCKGSCPADEPTAGEPCDVPSADQCVYSAGTCTCKAPSFGAATVWDC